MDLKKIAPLSIASMFFVIGCSFQKNPNKAEKAPIKVGMTKYELEEEILKNSATTFPDRLAYLIKNDNQSLALKLISEVSKDKVNEYNAVGETAIEITVRSDLDDLTMQLLRKGASPYLPRRGTNYGPIEYLNERADSKKDILDMISIADREFQKSAERDLMYGPGGIFEFLIFVRQPFYKKVNGNLRLVDIILDHPDELAHGQSTFPNCQISVDLLFGLIEKMEGPLADVNGFKLVRFGAALKSELLFNKGLALQNSFARAEREEIIKASIFSQSLKWMSVVFSKISTDQMSQQELVAMLKDSIRRMPKSAAHQAATDEIVQNFLKPYPDVYAALYAKAGIAEEIEENRKAKERGEVSNTELPGGKEVKESPLEERVNDLYKQIIERKEDSESCLQKT